MSDTDAPDAPDSPGDDGYTGAATLVADGISLAVEVTLRGQVDTISGSYHWYGRVAADPAVTAVAEQLGGRGNVTLRTPAGEATTTLSDVDPWGRFRVEGCGHAPFDVLTDVPSSD